MSRTAQGPLNWNPTSPGVVIGVTVMAEAGMTMPLPPAELANVNSENVRLPMVQVAPT